MTLPTMPLLPKLALLAVALSAALPALAQTTPGDHEYRALREALRENRMRVVEVRAQVVAVVAEGRFLLDVTAADLARSGLPEDYPLTVAAGGTQAVARILSAEQVRLRDAYAREQGSENPASDEVRLVVDPTRSSGADPRVELDLWSAGQLRPLALAAGDRVTITAVQPVRKGR